MIKQIPFSVPNLNIEIVENPRECIETGGVSTGGKFITEFENKIANYVIVPTFTFVAATEALGSYCDGN